MHTNHETYDDPIPWALLDIAFSLEPGPFRDLLTALADAWEELPDCWREMVVATPWASDRARGRG